MWPSRHRITIKDIRAIAAKTPLSSIEEIFTSKTLSVISKAKIAGEVSDMTGKGVLDKL